MTFQEIQELIKLLNKSNLAEFKIEDGDFKLSIRTALYAETKTTQVVSAAPSIMPIQAASVAPATPSPAPLAAPTAPPSTAKEEPAKPAATPEKVETSGKKYLEIKSPMVGTFYRSSSPEKAPYAEVGNSVKKGDVVCIIEAMKLFNEIETEVSGKIVKVMVDNAQPVEYDQVLFLVEPE
jgi:acetyl-CoA carboxylase biotin carboxyl carrier protein